jgi:lipopolysaccharide export system protein LptC
MLSAGYDLDRVHKRRDIAFRRAMRHSRVVRFLRLLIPAGSMALAIGFVALFTLARFAVNDAPATVLPEGLTDGKITMEEPRLTGFQKDSRSYEVTANRASQDVKTPNEVDLSKPIAKIETEAESFAHVNAETGLYDSVVETLKLNRDVRIKTDSGYTLQLDAANVDLKGGNLTSDQPVVVEMENGRIEAKSIDTKNGGKNVMFSGGVTSTFTGLFDTPPADGAASEAQK